MSVPAFAWALERGATLKLLAADRLVLIYLADLANGARVCWPGQPAIVRYTGLSAYTVLVSLKRLEARQLIRAEASPGRVTRYHILRQDTPLNGTGGPPATPLDYTVATPLNDIGAPPKISRGHPPNLEAEPPKIVVQTPLDQGDDPTSTQVRDPKSRAHAREAGKILSFGKKQEDTAPPPVPPATPGSDDFNSFLEAPTPAKALPAEIEQQVIHGEVLPPEAPLGPQATGAFVHSLARNFQNNYPPRAPRFSRAEQIDLCQHKSPIRPAYLPDAVLRVARMQLAERTHAP